MYEWDKENEDIKQSNTDLIFADFQKLEILKLRETDERTLCCIIETEKEDTLKAT